MFELAVGRDVHLRVEDLSTACTKPQAPDAITREIEEHRFSIPKSHELVASLQVARQNDQLEHAPTMTVGPNLAVVQVEVGQQLGAILEGTPYAREVLVVCASGFFARVVVPPKPPHAPTIPGVCGEYPARMTGDKKLSGKKAHLPIGIAFIVLSLQKPKATTETRAPDPEG